MWGCISVVTMPYSQISEDDVESQDTFLSHILRWRNDPTFCQVADVFFGNKSRISSAATSRGLLIQCRLLLQNYEIVFIILDAGKMVVEL